MYMYLPIEASFIGHHICNESAFVNKYAVICQQTFEFLIKDTHVTIWWRKHVPVQTGDA